jgi:L-amino acid N-acyltransferase YncA
MAIRSAQVTDLARIDEIYTQGLQLALRGEGATHPIRLWQMLTRTFSSLLPLSTPSEMLYVLEDHGRVMGFIQGEILSSSNGRLRSAEAVRVLNLSLAPELISAAGGSLIDHLCSEAIGLGVGRIYVRIPEGHPAMESFKAHGFQRYAQDRVFFRDTLGDPGSAAPIAGLRPARRRDMLGLFTLYLAATPRAVSQIEAPDFAQWRAVHEAEWLQRFSRRTSKSLVVEQSNEIVGWLGIEPGSPGRPHTVSMMARDDDASQGQLQLRLLDRARRELASHPGPIWCNVRNYDTITTRVLQDAGFEHLAGQELLVRELRARALAPARKTKKEKAMAPVFGAIGDSQFVTRPAAWRIAS